MKDESLPLSAKKEAVRNELLLFNFNQPRTDSPLEEPVDVDKPSTYCALEAAK
jgi:hypothetical protein